MTADNSGAEALPVFGHQPDPIASGNVVASVETCRCCERARGFIYARPTYSEEDLDDALCPWCIADGSAAEKFEVTFVDSEAFDDDATADVIASICERTPGFHSWQSEQWPSCCGEPAA